MAKEDEVLTFLKTKVFQPILDSPRASKELKAGVNLTIVRLRQRDAAGMVKYYWSAIVGTERSTRFARTMKREGFTRFEEVIDEFRDRFGDAWLRS